MRVEDREAKLSQPECEVQNHVWEVARCTASATNTDRYLADMHQQCHIRNAVSLTGSAQAGCIGRMVAISEGVDATTGLGGIPISQYQSRALLDQGLGSSMPLKEVPEVVGNLQSVFISMVGYTWRLGICDPCDSCGVGDRMD